MFVAELATEPVTPETVRSVMGTPEVGVPVGELGGRRS